MGSQTGFKGPTAASVQLLAARETLSGEVEVEILWQQSPLHQIAKTEHCGTAKGGFRILLGVFLAVNVNIKIEECKDLQMLVPHCFLMSHF